MRCRIGNVSLQVGESTCLRAAAYAASCAASSFTETSSLATNSSGPLRRQADLGKDIARFDTDIDCWPNVAKSK
jgi:hypothetical protein